MVLGSEVAVIITARRGKNWLVHTRGIDVKHVLQSSQDVASYLDKGGMSDVQHGRVMGTTGASSYGQVLLKGTRYTAVYRVINQLVVMTLSHKDVNVFNAINLVSTIARLLLHEFKGADISLEKVAVKKMAQVYLAIDAILSRGYMEMSPALSDAITQMETYYRSKSSKTPKGDVSLTMPIHPPLSSRRKVTAQSEVMKGFSFSMPQEVQDLPIPPPPQHNMAMDITSASGDPFAASAAVGSGDPNDPFAASAAVVTATDPNDPFATSNDPFAGPQANTGVQLTIDQLLVANDDPLAALQLGNKGFSTDAFPEGAWGGSAPGSQHPSALPSPAMSVRRLTTQDVLVGNPLLLKEIWRAEVQGSKVLKAGVMGQVQWASEDVRSLSASMQFSILAPEFPDSLLKKGLKCAQLSRVSASNGPKPGIFLAQSAAASSASSPMLFYQLPASFCPPPLTGQAGFKVQELQKGALVLVGLNYAVQPTLLNPIADLVVDIQLPSSMANPKKSEPQAEWSRIQSAGRFTLKGITQGKVGSVNILVQAMGGIKEVYAALKEVRITAKLRGKIGQSLSGTSLNQSPAGGNLTSTPDACAWEAHLFITLDVPDSPFAF